MSATNGTTPAQSYAPATSSSDEQGVTIYFWNGGGKVEIAPGRNGKEHTRVFQGDTLLAFSPQGFGHPRERQTLAESCALVLDNTEAGRVWLQRFTVLAAMREAVESPPAPEALPKPVPFPVEVLPGTLRRFVTDGARALPCPPDFLGVPMLAALGIAIGRSREVEVKTGWYESARIWSALVAFPGSKKSPALDLVMHPVYAAQDKMTEDYETAKIAYEKELLDYEKALLDWRRDKGGKVGHPGKKPEKPAYPQIYSTDATVEALASVLEQNPRGILYVSDELTGWAKAMNQYKGGKGRDRQSWLSFWNGAPVLVNRKNRDAPIHLSHPFVGVTGCLPPDMLSELSDEDGREDGFVHRVLFAYPVPEPLTWTETSVGPEVKDGYRDVILWLHNLTAGREDRPTLVTMMPAARDAFVAWVTQHYAEMGSADLIPHLKGPWAKMEGYCARLALVLHLARVACGETDRQHIDETSMQGAIALAEYFKAHARLVYRCLRHTAEDRRIEQAVTWMTRHGGKASERDVVTYKVAECKTMKHAGALLTALVEQGYGRIIEEPPPTGGRIRRVFRLSHYSALGTRG